MSIRILVVDDNDILREDLCQQLAKQPDFTVAGSASSGAEAVRLAMEVECDLILMDIEMESIRAGIDAATQIHSRRPKLQIIYLTAHDNDDMILTAMATGAVDYFVKGSDNDELYRHIRMAYEGNPIMSAHTQEVMLREYSRLRRKVHHHIKTLRRTQIIGKPVYQTDIPRLQGGEHAVSVYDGLVQEAVNQKPGEGCRHDDVCDPVHHASQPRIVLVCI